MNIEATATALAGDSHAQPIEPPAEVTTEAPMSEDDLLSAAFDKFTATEEPEAPEEPEVEEPAEPIEAADEATEEPEQADEAEEPAEPAPSDLPRGVRDAWKDIPDHAKEAIAASHRELTAKLGQQGRQIQGIAPIRDVLTEAIQTMPQMADMTPQQVAKEVFALAQLSHDFTAKPVETLMGYIRQHGLEGQMSAALSGQQAPQGAQQVHALTQHIQKLNQKIEQLSDPNYIRGQVSQYATETQVTDAVTQFAAKAEHWGSVEQHMPAAIQFVQAQLGEGASPQDVLSRAYDLAVSQIVPEAKAQTQAAEQAAVPVNPEKTKAQIRAKSVNVKSTPSGKQKPLSEDELLAQTFDKLQK